MDQIINSNSLGGEILGHFTVLIFSLLYFLMFLCQIFHLCGKDMLLLKHLDV